VNEVIYSDKCPHCGEETVEYRQDCTRCGQPLIGVFTVEPVLQRVLKA
jgi:uncharacterized OB-fold protein